MSVGLILLSVATVTVVVFKRTAHVRFQV